MKKEQNETQIREKQEKNIVAMAPQRRAMKEMGGSHFPLTPIYMNTYRVRKKRKEIRKKRKKKERKGD